MCATKSVSPNIRMSCSQAPTELHHECETIATLLLEARLTNMFDTIVMSGQKYPCLFSSSASISKSIATNVLQYHIIPGKALSSQQLKNNAATADYMASTAFNGKKLNVTKGGTKVNGYSNINNPDIGTKPSQAIHGIATLLVPPGLIVLPLFFYLVSN